MEGGDVSQPHLRFCLHSTRKNWWCKAYCLRFPFQFFLFNFLLVSCYWFLVLVTSSCEAGRREIRRFGGGRVWGISVKALPAFLPVKVFLTKRTFKATHNCTAYTKWGAVSLHAPSGGIFHSSPVLTAGWVKNWYCCARLVYLSGVIILCSFIQLRCWYEQS